MILPIKYKLYNSRLWVRAGLDDKWVVATIANAVTKKYIPITQEFGKDFIWNLNTNPEWKGRWFYKDIIGIPGHNGIDFVAPNGTRLHAPHDGKITELMVGDGKGIRLEGKEYSSIFYHLKEFHCSLNQEVKQGDFLALTDNTGRYTTAPHLHWGVRPINYVEDAYRGYMNFRGFIEDLTIYKFPFANGQCLMRTEVSKGANGEFYVVEDGDLVFKNSTKINKRIEIVDFFIKQNDKGLPKGFIQSITEDDFKVFNNLIK